MGQRFGDFELETLIGRGGMAEVFRARAVRGPLAGREVAIKRLLPALAASPEYVDLFVSEADVSRQLRHESIVPVLGSGVHGETYYIVLELIDGHDLAKLMKVCAERNIKLPIDLSVHVAHVVAEALHYAHQAKSPNGTPLRIVHCDVTPSNIFISRRGEIRLGDFGVAQAGVIGNTTGETAIAGKAWYLAPEQIEGTPVSPSTDVFALGAILFEMLTGRKAFPGDNVVEVLDRVSGGSVSRPSSLRPEISPALDRVVLRALNRLSPASPSGLDSIYKAFGAKREHRYASAGELAAELRDLYDHHIGTGLALASMLKGLLGQHVGGF